MAKLDRTPMPGFEKRDGETWDQHSDRMKKLLDELSAKSAKVDVESDALEGAQLQFQVADGYAIYIVSKVSPLTLRHVPYGDAYRANEATIRGVNKETVRKELRWRRSFEKMGDSNADFYASLKVGQTVHYHSSFNCWVRCTVVRGESAHSKGAEQNVLKPVALVGDWRPYDLPKRSPDGSVALGYHAESVVNGKTLTPHESMLWESGKMSSRYSDPTGLTPISLEVPPLSKEDEENAALWRKVNRLRAICNDRADDPRIILEAVRRAVEAA
jgi:hypothetical protein